MKKTLLALAFLAIAPVAFAENTSFSNAGTLGAFCDGATFGCQTGLTCDTTVGDTNYQTCQTDLSVNLNTTPTGASGGCTTNSTAAQCKNAQLNSAIQNATNNVVNGTYTCKPACTTGYTCTPGTLGNTCVASQQGITQSIQTSNSAPNSFVPLAPIPGLTQGATSDSSGIASFLNNLYKYLIGLAAALAVIEIIWGGLEIATQDSVSKKSDGRKRITDAVLGLVLILAPVLVFTIINPSILNLSVGMPALNTPTGTWAGGATTPIDQGVACASGTDCSAATQQCNSATGQDQSANNEPHACLKTGGTIDTSIAKNCVMYLTKVPDVCPADCTAAGDTYGIECTGNSVANGAGQAGLTTAQILAGADSRFNGSYDTLVKFTGVDAVHQAQNYPCQGGSSQTHQSFACTGSATDCVYALCTTPQLTYLGIQIGSVFTPSIESNTNYIAYSGQCQSIKDDLSADGATRADGVTWTTVFDNGASNAPAGGTVLCSTTQAAGQKPQCVQVTATCKLQ